MTRKIYDLQIQSTMSNDLYWRLIVLLFSVSLNCVMSTSHSPFSFLNTSSSFGIGSDSEIRKSKASLLSFFMSNPCELSIIFSFYRIALFFILRYTGVE